MKSLSRHLAEHLKYLACSALRPLNTDRWENQLGRYLYARQNEHLLRRWFRRNSHRFSGNLRRPGPVAGNLKGNMSLLARVATQLQGSQGWIRAQVLVVGAMSKSEKSLSPAALKLGAWLRLYSNGDGLQALRGNLLPLGMATQLLEAERRTATINEYVRCAYLNWRDPVRSWGVQAHEVVELPRVKQPVIVYIPTHFFATWDDKAGGARTKNWEKIRRIYSDLFDALGQSTVGVIAEHQLFQQLPELHPRLPAISFFTKGGDANCWHMRDTDFPGLVSIDPMGYWGCSVLSSNSKVIRQRLTELPLSPRRAVEAFAHGQALLTATGGDKYTEDKADYAATAPYIFCPLQSPEGLENHHGSVEGMIRILMELSRSSLHKVVFKRHPLCKSEQIEALLAEAVATSKCEVQSISTWSLVKNAHAVVTMNSAVALQAVLAEKKLFLMGNTDVSCVAINAATEEELRDNLAPLFAGGPAHVDIDLYCKFSWLYFYKYLVNVRDPRSVVTRLTFIAEANANRSIEGNFIELLFEMEAIESDVNAVT